MEIMSWPLANIAAIKIEQHGGAYNEKLKLNTLVYSVGADLQAIFHISNWLWIKKRLKIFERADKSKDNPFSWNAYLKKITRWAYKSLDLVKNHLATGVAPGLPFCNFWESQIVHEKKKFICQKKQKCKKTYECKYMR